MTTPDTSEYFAALSYARHNARRLEHLASLGLDLDGKTVLEVGAGVGDLTGFFLDRGCAVTCVEPRAENYQRYAELFPLRRFPDNVRAQLFNIDVESVGQLITDTFDVVFCYGLLYHLHDPETVLRMLAERCTGLLLLETCVSAGPGEALNPVDEPAENATQSFHGGGCRPTRPWVFNRLKGLFPHVYVPATQPAHEQFPLDWSAVSDDVLTRAVFVAARQPLAAPLLLDHLPDRQARA